MSRIRPAATFFILISLASTLRAGILSTAGPTRFQLLGTSGKTWTTIRGQASAQALLFEFNRAHSRRTEYGVVVAPYLFRQPANWFAEGRESVGAVSVAAVWRRAFLERPSMRPFVDVSFGPLFAEHQVPAKTARFNFETQFGAGAVLFPERSFPVVVGYRFAHISNAGISPRNPGWNMSSVILGIRLRR